MAPVAFDDDLAVVVRESGEGSEESDKRFLAKGLHYHVGSNYEIGARDRIQLAPARGVGSGRA